MSVSSSPAAVSAQPHPGRWKALAFLGLAQFMLILDVTVVAIALPLMEADLALSREAVTWVVAAYTVTFGGLMIFGGRLADLFGSKAIVFVGLGLFVIASLVCGLADTGQMLLSGRVGQGVGAALLSPAALSVVVRLFEGEERNRALGIWSALGGGGAAIGVLLGGLIAAGPGWPWVFFVNVPVGLVIFVALVLLLPGMPRAGDERARLDVLGAVLVTAATAALIYGLIRAGEPGGGAAAGGFVAGALVLYLVFALWQRTATTPLMNLGLVGRRPVAAGVFVILIATALMVAVFFLGTFYFQGRAGYGPLVTGLLFLPIAITTMLGANLGGRLIATLGARRLGVAGMVIAAAGLLAPALWPTTLATVVGVSVGALGIGALFVVASATALGQVEPAEAGVASGLLSTFHEFGASIGVATVSSVAAASLAGSDATGFQSAFLVAAIAAMVAAVIAGLLIPRTGR